MDTTTKILGLLVGSGIIILGVGVSYLPQLGGTVPPTKSVEQFNKEQTEIIINSAGFKASIVGISTVVLSCLTLVIRLYRETRILPLSQTSHLGNTSEVQRNPKPILKVTRNSNNSNQ